ncbi:MAG: Wzz/FepE/Etk N-terminal domain-containing protein [Bacteroidota bacterium]
MENSKQIVKQEKSFIDFAILIVKWRKFIIFNVLLITILATIISFFIPKWYTSTASVMPPKSKGGLLGDIGSFSSTIKDLSRTLGRLGTVSDEAYNYLAILKSRSSYEKVINKFDLRKVYDFKASEPIESVLKELDSNVKFNVEDEGNITIKVTDNNPQRAAEMANYFVEVLNEISIDLGTAEAKNNREFIEKRYIQSLNDIKNAEDSLKNFSRKYSVFSLAEQTKAAITIAAELKAKIEIQKIELDIFKKSYGNDNPLIADKQLMINEMQAQLNKMKYANIDGQRDVNLFTPFSELPEVGVKYIRLKGEYELQAKILEFIVPIYEQAKIEEKKDIPVCLFLDKAVPAQEKAGPKKAFIIIIAFLISFIFALVWMLFAENWSKMQADEIRYRKVHEEIVLPLRKMFFLNR